MKISTVVIWPPRLLEEKNRSWRDSTKVVAFFLATMLYSMSTFATGTMWKELGTCIGNVRYYYVSYSFTGTCRNDYYFIFKNGTLWSGPLISSGQDPDVYCSPLAAGQGNYETHSGAESAYNDNDEVVLSNVITVPFQTCSGGGQQ